MRSLLLALCLVVGIAQSQEPSPTPSISIQKPKADAKGVKGRAEKDQRGTTQMPLVIQGIPSPRDQEETTQRRKDHEEEATINRGIRDFTGLAALFTFLLFCATAIQVGMFWRQLKLMQQATKDAGAAAKAANTSANAVMLAERAYVKMSHVPPGIQWNAPDERGFTVTVNVKNYGRTPASVTDVVLGIKVLPNDESLPEIPDYSTPPKEEIPSAFLMPGDWFNYPRSFGLFDKFEAVKNKSSKVYVYGYVDYTDVFHRRQRGGYARVYNRWIDDGTQNNLVLVTQPGYNYDRPREKGEGNDW